MAEIPGRIKTTAMDRAFFCWHELGISELMIILEMEFDKHLDTDRLEQALQVLFDAQPVLGTCFVPDPRRPYWQRLEPGERTALTVTTNPDEYEAFRVSSVEHTKGPLVRVFLLDTGAGHRMILKVSHIVSDTGGVKEIGYYLAEIYSRLGDDPAYSPEPNLNGSRGLLQIFRHVAWYSLPKLCLHFLGHMRLNTVSALALKFPPSEGRGAPTKYLMRHVEPARGNALLEYSRSHDSTLNDIVVAAVFRALARTAKWDGIENLRLRTTVDLRRWYIPGGQADGICNLIGYEFPTPGKTLGDNYDDTLSKIALHMKQRKKAFPGLPMTLITPLYELLSYRQLLKFFSTMTQTDVASKSISPAFTNLGPINPDKLSFGGISPARAWLLPPVTFPPLFGIGFSGYRGALTLSSGVPLTSRQTVDPFMDNIIDELPCK